MAEDKKEELQETAAEATENTQETPKAEAPTEEVKEEVAETKEEVTEKAPVEEEAPVAEKVEKPAKEEAPKVPVKEEWVEFDDSGFGTEYTDAQRQELETLYGGTLTTISEKEVIKGHVVGITDRDVIVNIGFKSDGLVALSEFRDNPDLKAGDEVEVYIEEQENANGQLILSRRKAKIVKAWENIQSALDEDTVIEGLVKRRTKGGLIVDIYGVEAFLPGSQIDVKPIRDFDVFVGKKMEVKVVKINYSNDNVVVSHKVLIEKDLEEQKAQILNNLEKGQVLEGVIKNMTNFGVFIDLGGVDGLLHITDISWGRINHPEEVLNLDEKVNVVVLDFDDDKKRISLGMKQLTAHPWDSLDAAIEIGSKVKGKIVNVADYGAFLEIIPGVEGLIHVSEMSWSQHLRNPQDFMDVGDQMEAVVLTIDRDERKMSLGIKQLTEDPWTKQDLLTKYAVSTKHTGIVRNLTNFGLFIELEEGIDGLVHVSDLSWTKKIKHPSEFVKVNEELEVVVMELDTDNRRLALSHKHLEENPWDTFETVFVRGSIHKCTIINSTDKTAFLELPYGLEGQCSLKNLGKADGTSATEGETLDFMVIDFSKDDKRIHLTHTGTWKEGNKEAIAAKAAGASGVSSAKKKPKGKTLDKINKEVEKSTLGDLAALSALKDKMEGDTTPPKAEAKPKKAKAAKKEEAPAAEAAPAEEAPAAEAAPAEEAPAKEEAPAAETDRADEAKSAE
ncbi:MAG: 30S ribosomal protein S1 [Cyclobacteriaceae bacterium]